MNSWISADLHLGHPNIAGPTVSNWKTGYRNFESVHAMNTTIIDNINKYVAENDQFFLIGDFCFGGHYRTPDFRRQIACKNIHVILGNHDQHLHKYTDYFSSVQYYLEKTFQLDRRKVQFVFLHYAMRVWNGSHRGAMHGYGHSHGSLEHSPNGKSMDFGIDNAYRLFGEYRPFSVKEGVEILDNREIAFHDHHSLERNTQ